MQQKTLKAKNLAHLLLTATRSNYGPRPEIIKWVITGVIRPMLAYAAMVWAHEISLSKVRQQLLKIDRVTMLAIASVKPSTPTEGLRIIYNIMPLELFLQKVAVDSYVRLNEVLVDNWRGTGKNKTYSVSHLHRWQERLDAIGMSGVELDRTRKVNWERDFLVESTSIGRNTEPQMVRHAIHTDGSATENGVGAGYMAYYCATRLGSHSERLRSGTTVFQAELLAITRAAEYVKSNWGLYSDKHVVIRSDSAAALQSIQSHKIHSKTVECAVEALKQAAGVAATITLSWVKAHVGYEGNEEADRLAKIGAESQNLEETLLPTPLCHIKTKTAQSFETEWVNRWRNYKHARKTKLFFDAPAPRKTNALIKLTRGKLSMMVTLLTGHNNLAYHTSLCDESLTDGCTYCNTSAETFHHLLTECPAFIHSRADIFGAYELDRGRMTWRVDQVVEFAGQRRIEDLLFNYMDDSRDDQPGGESDE